MRLTSLVFYFLNPSLLVMLSPADRIDLKKLGQAVRALRVAKGLSQHQLSVIANIDRKQISVLERGAAELRTGTLMKIFAALGFDICKHLEKSANRYSK